MNDNKNTAIPVSADAMKKFDEIRKSNKPQLEKDIEIIALFDEVEKVFRNSEELMPIGEFEIELVGKPFYGVSRLV